MCEKLSRFFLCSADGQSVRCSSEPQCCESCDGHECIDDDLNARPVVDEILVVNGLCKEGQPYIRQAGPVLDPKGELVLPAFPEAHSTERFARRTQNPRRVTAETRNVFLDQDKLGSAMLGTPAVMYHADQSDMIDVLISHCIRSLDDYARATLLLRRVSPGSYEIDGRRVTLRLGNTFDPSSVTVTEEGAEPQEEMPLPAYLAQAAHVAVSLGGEQARSLRRLTTSFDTPGFRTPRQEGDPDVPGNDRCLAMRVACEESRLREVTKQQAKARLDSISPITSRQRTPVLTSDQTRPTAQVVQWTRGSL